MDTILIPYSGARQKIRDGDLLLFRRENRLTSRLIAAAGRSEYCHAAMAAWWNERLMCLETVQSHGGRAIMLSAAVADVPQHGLQSAAVVVAALPPLLVYLFGGRYFVRGLTAGAVK